MMQVDIVLLAGEIGDSVMACEADEIGQWSVRYVIEAVVRVCAEACIEMDVVHDIVDEYLKERGNEHGRDYAGMYQAILEDYYCFGLKEVCDD